MSLTTVVENCKLLAMAVDNFQSLGGLGVGVGGGVPPPATRKGVWGSAVSSPNGVCRFIFFLICY